MSAHWNYTSHLLVHLSLETLSPPLHLGRCYNISRIWSWSCRPVVDSRILLFNVHFNSTLARLQAPPHSGSGCMYRLFSWSQLSGSDLPRALEHFACLLEDRVSYLSFNFLFSIYPFTLHFQTTAVSEKTRLKKLKQSMYLCRRYTKK